MELKRGELINPTPITYMRKEEALAKLKRLHYIKTIVYGLGIPPSDAPIWNDRRKIIEEITL